jgi:hypothetical protein
MSHIARYVGFDRPLKVKAVDGEVLATSDQSPVEIALTHEAATQTGRRLIEAARVARRAKAAKSVVK